VQNVPYVAASMDALVANVIGTGITPRFTGAAGEKLNALFAEWADVCDADGRWTSSASRPRPIARWSRTARCSCACARVASTMAARAAAAAAARDRLARQHTQLAAARRAGAGIGNVIVEGIEYDAIGRVAAYWLWDNTRAT
jgi:hypothetical protein